MKKVFVLYNFESKECENFSDIIGIFDSIESAEKVLMKESETFQSRYKNPEYYSDEYKDGYYMTTQLSGFSFAFVSNSNGDYYNAYRICEFELPDDATMAFIVTNQTSVSNPKLCFRGPVDAFSTKEGATNFIGCDMRDSYIAIDNDYFGNDFDELVSDSDENTIESTMGYFLNWEIEPFYVNF